MKSSLKKGHLLWNIRENRDLIDMKAREDIKRIEKTISAFKYYYGLN